MYYSLFENNNNKLLELDELHEVKQFLKTLL